MNLHQFEGFWARNSLFGNHRRTPDGTSQYSTSKELLPGPIAVPSILSLFSYFPKAERVLGLLGVRWAEDLED
jgi:hypothetical protein